MPQIATTDAWWRSRLRPSGAVYDSAEPATPAVALGDHGPQPAAAQAVVELAVSLGPRRFPCRLLASRVPAEVVEQRRRRA